MRRQLAAIIRPFVMALLTLAAFVLPVRAEDNVRIQEEIWALPLPLPMFAYVVRPVGDGPFPLAIMNHGVLQQIGRPQDALAAYRAGIEVAKRKGDRQAEKEMAVFARRIERALDAAG